MAGAEPAAGARAGGILSSLKRLVATAATIVRTRLELLAAEVQVERRRLTQLLVLTAAALFFLAGGVLLLTLLVIVAFWDSNRLLAIGICAFVYLALGGVLVAAARQRAAAGSQMFQASLAQLQKDRDSLSA